MIQGWSRARILAVVVALVTFHSGAAAQRAIPDDNLAYPILISLGNGSSGSGFFLNTSNATYLVTAKHVLFSQPNQGLLSPHLDLLCYSRDPADPTKIQIAVDLSILQASGKVKPHPTQDVVVVELFDADQPPSTPTGQPGATPPRPTVHVLPGVTVQSMAKTGILGVALDAVKTFDQVLTGNEVMLFGYPSSLALQEVQQLDASRPLLRKGIVAGTNPAKKSLILDCPVYFGNSGGPVLEMDKDGFQTQFKIIGVVNQYVPFVQSGGSQTFAMQILSNSGYSIATPMDFVLELTK
jgi:Trypsin-like peptidase domain